MDAGTAYTAQTYNLTSQFLPKEWIMEKWEEGFYITAMAGSNSGWSLVAMSKGTAYTQQSYKARCLPCWALCVSFRMRFAPLQLALLGTVCVFLDALPRGSALNRQAVAGDCNVSACPPARLCACRCPTRSRSSGSTRSGRRASM
jgi:hypothetical protein